ncbi:hypothetical protein EVAR_91196_1 [Eumeta japonica]|uniref:Uncharacterized protein n=1 Tax=Eumeta variegata TaxID=151549 RepID=A0A4C1ZMD6_EUMVA|nr:hypothetical protein EVAR_91196_1 [Eumeta japonica]
MAVSSAKVPVVKDSDANKFSVNNGGGSGRHRVQEDAFLEARREQRERLGRRGAPALWANSPPRPPKFGFKKDHSKTEANVELIQQVFDAWEDSKNAICILCDLYKNALTLHRKKIPGRNELGASVTLTF